MSSADLGRPVNKDSYSYSRLSTFRECPRRYEYRYIERRREAFQSVEAFAGQTVHEVLAWLYAERERAPAPTVAAALDRFDETWQRGLTSNVRLVRANDSFERRKEDARQMVARHHAEGFVRDDLQSVAIEERFDLPLADRHAFGGVIDRLARDSRGNLHVIDYKTTGRPPAVHGEEETLQLRSYGLAGMREHGVGEITLRYLYLKNGDEYATNLTADAAPETERVLVERIDATLAAREFPARPSALCAWCGFREICDASGFAESVTAESDAGAADSRCPRCTKSLQQRNGRHGPFLGCSGYPVCRYTRNI